VNPHSRPLRRSTSSVEIRGDRATLILRRFLRHPPRVVWDALTDPEQVRQWFLTAARIDGRVGGTVDLITGPTRVHATGQILSWDPPHVYEYEWNVRPEDDHQYGGEQTVVRWELTPQDGGTLVVVTHRDLTKNTARIFELGMQAFLNRLDALLDGRALPDWEEQIREIRGASSGSSPPPGWTVSSISDTRPPSGPLAR
jgi:uncharacterized protein YndB with AHSA1/START domain